MNKYMSGTRVRSIAVFTDVNGAAKDPTAVEIKYRIGVAAPVVPAATKDGVGVYHYDIDTTGWAGPDVVLCACQWKGTGDVVAIDVDYFEIEPPAL